MGLSTDGTPYLVLDLETAPLSDAGEYVQFAPEPEMPALDKRFTDPAKVAADKAAKEAQHQANLEKWEQAKAEQVYGCAVNPDLAQIVAVGAWPNQGIGTITATREQNIEANLIRSVSDWIGPTTIVVGFNVRFDLAMLMRRALYLGVPFPRFGLDKYRPAMLVDLQDILTFQNYLPTKGRSLDFYRRRFALDVPEDEISGEDVPRLFAENTPEAWAKIRRHCELDVLTTRLLAERLGVLKPVAVESAA
jgi:hypothetical protein